VLKTSTLFLDLHMLVRDRSIQVCQGLLKLDIVLSNALRRALLEAVLGVPVFLLQVLETIIVLQGLPKNHPRVRGLVTSICRLIRLVHTGPQGPWSTFQIGRCQTGIIRIWSGTQVVLNNGIHCFTFASFFLFPYLEGAAGRKQSAFLVARAWA
jgi:hypothetical protein